MSLSSHYESSGCAISFELFPPKTPAGLEALCENVRRLSRFNPSFFTCTYGAGGSEQGATLEVLKHVRDITDLPVASHLTCVNSSVAELEAYLERADHQGTDYIVALRGDPPKGTTRFVPSDGGLRYANELVELIRDKFSKFGVAVAGYPEVHQEAPNAMTDLANLKRKVDAGADVIITQLFYNNEDFYRFRDRCVEAGISVPIVPGILPVTNYSQACRIASMCKASIPKQLETSMVEHDEDTVAQFEIGVEHARQQTIDLIEHGVPGIHYYVLNKSDAATSLFDGLQIMQ